MKPRLKHWARQGMYAALLVVVVMGLCTLHWSGAPLVRAYTVFFLTEKMDFGNILSPLREWASDEGLDDWWPPWQRWIPGDQHGEPPEAPIPPAVEPAPRDTVAFRSPTGFP